MSQKTWISNLCDVLGVDEKELEKHKQTQTPSSGLVEKLLPNKQDKPKKQDKTKNSSAGGASSGGNINSKKNTVTINKPPSPTTMFSTAADDPLTAYCNDLNKQKA